MNVSSGWALMRFGPPIVVRVPTLKVMSPAGAAPKVSAVISVPLAKVTVSAVNVMAPGVLAALPPLIVVRTVAFSRNTVFAAVPPNPWIVIVPALPISPAGALHRRRLQPHRRRRQGNAAAMAGTVR